MIYFQNQNDFHLDDLEKRDSSVSTLLIPTYLMDDFLKVKQKCRNNLSLYLRILLKRYRTLTYSGLIPKPLKVKTEFQDKDLNLNRQNFRPMNADWIELGELALAFGKSRCWLFVYLLKLDIAGMWRILRKAKLNFGVPTSPKVELRSFWTLQRFHDNFLRSYYVKV